MTETIQQLKEDIAILQEKLRKLETQQEPQMTLKKSGDCDVISYDHKYYYRLSFGVGDFYWYKRYVGSSNLMRVEDPEEHRLLEELYDGVILDTGGVVETEKRKIDDLAEKLLPDDHPYKIADEHGELNPYKQYLNSVEDEKKMEELGFVKNSDGSWTAQPLGETTQERGEKIHKEMEEKLQEKEWNIKVVTDYLTGKSRHKLNIVDKDGNDYKPEPITTEELLKPHWEPKPQTEKEVEEGLRSAMRKAKEDGVFDEPKESWMDKPIDDLVDKLMENPPDCLKFQLSPSLEDRIYKWWDTCFVQHPEWSMEECVEDLLDIIELFLPNFQSAAGSQSLGVEDMVEGFNDCLRKIKSKLRTPHKRDT